MPDSPQREDDMLSSQTSVLERVESVAPLGKLRNSTILKSADDNQ